MTLEQIIRDEARRIVLDEDDLPLELELLPGMSDDELTELAARLPCPIPAEVEALLRFTRGFNGAAADVDFSGEYAAFELADVFPHGHPIAHDGFGNFWVVDLLPESTSWGPIFFACHDAPVILHQCDTLEQFVAELLRMRGATGESMIRDVHEDALFDVWRSNPGTLRKTEAVASGDASLVAFAESLDDDFLLIDMRKPEVGFGFSWGRYGPNTELRRHGHERIFAYARARRRPAPPSEPGLLSRLWERLTR